MMLVSVGRQRYSSRMSFIMCFQLLLVYISSRYVQLDHQRSHALISRGLADKNTGAVHYLRVASYVMSKSERALSYCEERDFNFTDQFVFGFDAHSFIHILLFHIF